MQKSRRKNKIPPKITTLKDLLYIYIYVYVYLSLRVPPTSYVSYGYFPLIFRIFLT